ncbi:uncharacterized protein [Macrobrachium rosenbergii]|uniref:uncharacterized protein isoform X1 n=1 Tax=Macrobrachium rosenbergii TaxID=79674 RepID=UPI0034D3A2E7
MKCVIELSAVVLVIFLTLEPAVGNEGSHKHKRRHSGKSVGMQMQSPKVKPWKEWRRWWEEQDDQSKNHVVSGPSRGRQYYSRGPGSRQSTLTGATIPEPGSDSFNYDLVELGGGLYNSWTSWSKCSRRCKQRRRRTCRVPAVCGSAMLKEERSCSGGRCTGRRPFHIIRPEEFTRQPPKNDMRVLLNFNSMFYTRWSRWSSCSRSCLTRRHRSCKYPLFCGARVVNEEAYCYVEGSLCEKWYRRNRKQPRKHKPKGDGGEDDSEPLKTQVSTTPYTPSHSSFSWSSSSSPERSLPKECGISNVTTPKWSLRILGGREAQPGEWPWQVVILNRYREAFCGGTLVAPQWVLTAAHCVRRKLYVRLGEHDLAVREGAELDYKVSRSVTHPKYDSTTVDNDVALLQLPEPVDPGPRIFPACLPEQGATLPVGDTCTIIGWGKERNTHIFGTDVLHEAEVVPIIASNVCEAVYEDYYITSNMFCAGYRRGRVDSCAGDSGGPLLCQRQGRWYIYGITSFGEGCGKRGKFGIYAKVSNYRHWVQSVIAAPDP